ncbi:MAG: TOTE conflict system archaeo-eukaryotic primase domain-containing protein [Burkholderiales bacterium]
MGSFEVNDLEALRAENARLILLLESHGIEWRLPLPPAVPEREPSRLSTDEKVALFRRLFQGRTDVYPVRWESKTTGKTGYSPACANEWRYAFRKPTLTASTIRC